MNELFLKEFRANVFRGLKLINILNFDPKAALGPIRVDIAATSACNYKCCFCQSHSYLRSGSVTPVSMDGETIRKLLLDLKELHVKEVLFSGNGEPLLSKDLIEHLKRRGDDFKIEILTNGGFLSLVDETLFNTLTYLTISINSGNGASHQITHGYKGQNQFSDITTNIGRLLKLRGSHDKIKLNYVITADNYGEIGDFFRLVTDWDVAFMARPVNTIFEELSPKALSPLMLNDIREKALRYAAGRNLSRRLALSFRLLDKTCQITNRNQEHSKVLYPCYYSFIQTYIESNGDILLCPSGKEKPLGNLNTESFRSIWQKKENLALRIEATQMQKTNRPVFSSCYDCNNVQLHSLAFHNMYTKIPFLSNRLRETT